MIGGLIVSNELNNVQHGQNQIIWTDSIWILIGWLLWTNCLAKCGNRPGETFLLRCETSVHLLFETATTTWHHDHCKFQHDTQRSHKLNLLRNSKTTRWKQWQRWRLQMKMCASYLKEWIIKYNLSLLRLHWNFNNGFVYRWLLTRPTQAKWQRVIMYLKK